MSDPTDQPSPPADDASEPAPLEEQAPQAEAAIDVEAEQDRLDRLGSESARVAADAEADLEPGGGGRTFADQGVRAGAADDGDTDHPPADA